MPILGNQIKTLNLQTSYDAKLNNATYDAVKAFQLNTINSDTSEIVNSKIRDIEASANTFFNSITSNFNMAGYNQDILSEYVPALVYTMYDGFYIYSKYTNTLDRNNFNEVIITDDEENSETLTGSDAVLSREEKLDSTYKDDEKLSGLRPYVYYSCRYVYNGNDFVITYSLDNYITIQGQINVTGKGMQWVNDGGYLLENIDKLDEDTFLYRKIAIDKNETLKENLLIDGKKEEYAYIKINGVKYYKNNNNDEWFTIMNGTKYPQKDFEGKADKTTNAGMRYYQAAYNFTNRIKKDYNLGGLTADCAKDENGMNVVELNEQGERTDKLKFGNQKVFDFGNSNSSIEDPNSNFNQHRLAVIRYSIEKNLSLAIANYNDYTTVITDFQMPKLREDEWEKIVNNVSVISFLQGLNIGGKIYNGYSIITNNKNKEVVNEDSIYMITGDNQYHRANDIDLQEGRNDIEGGFLNIDFERKTLLNENGETTYYIPKVKGNDVTTGCYTSIVNQTNVEATDNFYEYMEEKGGKLASKYFTALGRERYSMYRVNNDPIESKKEFY